MFVEDGWMRMTERGSREPEADSQRERASERAPDAVWEGYLIDDITPLFPTSSLFVAHMNTHASIFALSPSHAPPPAPAGPPRPSRRTVRPCGPTKQTRLVIIGANVAESEVVHMRGRRNVLSLCQLGCIHIDYGSFWSTDQNYL